MSLIKYYKKSLAVKIIALIVVTNLPIIGIFNFLILPKIEDNYYESRRAELKTAVETAYSTLSNYYKKEKNGLLSREEAINQAIEDINSIRYANNDYYFVYDYDGVLMASGRTPEARGENWIDKEDKLGNKYIKMMADVAKSAGKGYVTYYFPKLGSDIALPKESYTLAFPEWNCFIASGLYIDDIEEQIADLRNDIILAIIIGALLALAIGYYFSRKITNPILELNSAAKQVSDGNTKIKVEVKTEDEVGQLSEIFNKMVSDINTSIEEVKIKGEEANKAAMEAEIAKKEAENQKQYLSKSVDLLLVNMDKFSDGDLTVKLNIERDDEIGRLYNGFNKSVERINEILLRVDEAVSATASASAEISSSAEEMAAGSQEQSAQTNEVASAVEEMTRTILENSQNTSFAAQTAKNAGENAAEGGKVVNETIQGMDRIDIVVKQSADTVFTLGQNSDKIGEIVQVINDIADQTNLLALNAAIEAARAGEQGRGFAVVADEVRKLAERTSKATKEIAVMIKTIQKDTTEAVESIKKGTVEVEQGKMKASQAGVVLKKIVDGAKKLTDLVTQVAASSEQQSATAEQIGRNIESINNVTGEAANAVQQIATAAEDLNKLTLDLQTLISQFKLQKGFDANRIQKNNYLN